MITSSIFSLSTSHFKSKLSSLMKEYLFVIHSFIIFRLLFKILLLSSLFNSSFFSFR